MVKTWKKSETGTGITKEDKLPFNLHFSFPPKAAF